MAPFLHLDRHSMKTYLRFFPLFLAMASILLFQQNCIKEYEGLIGFRCSKETETSQECGGKPCRGGRCGACVENAQCSGGEVCCVPNSPPNADPAVRYCRPAAQCSSPSESQTEGTPEPSNEPASTEEPAQPDETPPPDGAEEAPSPETVDCFGKCPTDQYCCDRKCWILAELKNCKSVCSDPSDCSLLGELCCIVSVGIPPEQRCLDQTITKIGLTCERRQP